ncbi:MAG: NAD(P)H-hydrate epimerase [Planctomycetota bacterium]
MTEKASRTALDLARTAPELLSPQDSVQARRLDRAATELLAMPSMLLMENAARAVAELAADRSAGGAFLVLAGKGNNGGDGLAAARLLSPRSRVALLQVPDEQNSPDAALQLSILEAARIPVSIAPSGAALDELASGADLIIDALLGTGLDSAPRGPIGEWIRWANARPEPVLAVDVPSGLSADDGTPFDPTIRARWTVSFARPKRGLLSPQGREHGGQLVVASIGLPEDWVEAWERG